MTGTPTRDWLLTQRLLRHLHSPDAREHLDHLCPGWDQELTRDDLRYVFGSTSRQLIGARVQWARARGLDERTDSFRAFQDDLTSEPAEPPVAESPDPSTETGGPRLPTA